jgi:hypothetical protein
LRRRPIDLSAPIAILSVTIAAPLCDMNGRDTVAPTDSAMLTAEPSTIADVPAPTPAPPSATPSRAA